MLNYASVFYTCEEKAVKRNATMGSTVACSLSSAARPLRFSGGKKSRFDGFMQAEMEYLEPLIGY